jgi:hypothetical protein
MYCCFSKFLFSSNLGIGYNVLSQIAFQFFCVYSTNRIFSRLKQAAVDPSALTQEAIIDNLDSAERGRLSRLRNIGIAVGTPSGDVQKGD